MIERKLDRMLCCNWLVQSSPAAGHERAPGSSRTEVSRGAPPGLLEFTRPVPPVVIKY